MLLQCCPESLNRCLSLPKDCNLIVTDYFICKFNNCKVIYACSEATPSRWCIQFTPSQTFQPTFRFHFLLVQNKGLRRKNYSLLK